MDLYEKDHKPSISVERTYTGEQRVTIACVMCHAFVWNVFRWGYVIGIKSS